MNNQEIMERYQRARDIADRIETMRQRRIDVLAARSRIGRCMCTLHNALLDREAGRPWPGIDYRAAREMRRVTDDFRHFRLCDELYRRLTGLPAV